MVASYREPLKKGVRTGKKLVSRTYFDAKCYDFLKDEQEKLRGVEFPDGWNEFQSKDRYYYVHDKSKKTSWIDPRTKKTRKEKVEQVQDGQLPYGWTENFDGTYGRFYVDHNTATTYLDPPWDVKVREQNKAIEDVIKKVSTEILPDLVKENEAHNDRLKKAQDEVFRLDKERMELEVQLLAMRQLAMQKAGVEVDDVSDSESELEDLRSKIEDTNEKIRLEQERLDAIKDEVNPDEVKETLQAIEDLKNLGKTEEGGNEIKDIEETQEAINEVTGYLQKEQENRRKMEEEILVLKKQIEDMMVNGVTSKTAEENVEDIQKEEPQSVAPVVETPPSPKSKERRTKMEMQIELLNLKKRLVQEKEEKKRVENLKGRIERGGFDDSGKVPDWVKKIEDVASNSRTLRLKIGRKQQDNPDQMSFRERMLFYASGAIENKN